MCVGRRRTTKPYSVTAASHDTLNVPPAASPRSAPRGLSPFSHAFHAFHYGLSINLTPILPRARALLLLRFLGTNPSYVRRVISVIDHAHNKTIPPHWNRCINSMPINETKTSWLPPHREEAHHLGRPRPHAPAKRP